MATSAFSVRVQVEKELSGRLMVRYAKERAEERSARLTGLVHVGEDGKKMQAFYDSAYGDDR